MKQASRLTILILKNGSNDFHINISSNAEVHIDFLAFFFVVVGDVQWHQLNMHLC